MSNRQLRRERARENAKKKKPRKSSSTPLIIMFFLFIAAAMYGGATAVSKRIHLVRGSLTTLEQTSRTIQVTRKSGKISTFHYSADTKFLAAGSALEVNPSWIGKGVSVRFHESMFFDDSVESVKLDTSQVPLAATADP